MTTFGFPPLIPNETVIDLISNTSTFESPITRSVQTVDRGGERWRIRMTFRNLRNDDRAVMMAWLARLNGRQHRFTLPNHAEQQRGALNGSPLVNGGGQTGNTLNIDGCNSSVSNWIRAGDFFGVNGELKMSITDEDSNGSGEVGLEFAPRLLSAPPNNSVITVSGATGVFMLADEVSSWTNKPGGFSDFAITAIEDIAA